MIRFFRAAYRFFLALFIFLGAYLDFLFGIKLRGEASSLKARAAWLQKWASLLLRLMHVDVEFEGAPPTRGLMVSNHLSYVDVFVYGSICPLIFLSKSEVRSWPIAGSLTHCAGTLYLMRQSKADLVRLGKAMEPVVNSGMVLTLFLEGTSSDGSKVLPFRSSLLAPAEEHRWSVTPAWIHYTMQDGSAEEDVCYWGDMTFFPHFLKLLSRKQVQAHVRFGPPTTEKLSRKELARELHTRICQIKAKYEAAQKSQSKSK